ncbi:hypothetical protein GQ53DRAFT_672776 [Thozetella sp. PMI_491]|nr:hypothetical protein GQ53DRAFT_672776 [Thozetella sp. PMI_491]
MATAAETTAKLEAEFKRNPHGNFKEVEASRPLFDRSAEFHWTQTVQPEWTYGSGGNDSDPAAKTAKHVSIDPFDPARPARLNYKLLIGAVVPRPIAFLSTVSKDGTSTNLAPFSFFNMMGHDPPIFVVGFASSVAAAKDSLRNLIESGECVINIISEGYVEAANSTSVNAPYGVSEWDVSGLTPVHDCQEVKAARVKEAIFSIEGKLDSYREIESRSKPGSKSTTIATIEGVRFWAREDAINADRDMLDPKVLRPVGRLGGVSYGRTTQAFELLRPDFEKDLGGKEAVEKLKTGNPAN